MQFLRKLMVIHNRGLSYDGVGDGGSQRLKYIFYSFRALGLLSRRYRFSMKSSKYIGKRVSFHFSYYHTHFCPSLPLLIVNFLNALIYVSYFLQKLVEYIYIISLRGCRETCLVQKKF
ncbi:hypothetical protein CXB51_031215 [Gossypium anomalum]|uniref:Uncharacterized protein n=1 Tax=Gossypium anomalum TaxID=47600 RepID=A0A8J5Y1U6_9ROSI|nr:hypothetical protein CXB51_031215 [Gossypium anomalum]